MNNNNITPQEQQNTTIDVQSISEQLNAIDRRVTETNNLVRNHLGLVDQPTNEMENGEQNTHGFDQAALERDIARTISVPDFGGARDIPFTPAEALVGFQPTSTNKTPSSPARIGALINYLWKRNNNTEVNISEDDKEFRRLQFRAMARQMRATMTNNGCNATSWREISDREQRYYALKLEQQIGKTGYNISRCRNRWAANILLQDCMRNERLTANRRARRLAASSNEERNGGERNDAPARRSRTRRNQQENQN